MGYDKLEQNLIDIIKEEQAKLGFFKEDIRLYYPLSSLNHFFNSSDSADEMQMRLDTLPESITSKLGQIEVSHKGDRFRKRKRKPVLSHSRFRGSAARMLRSSRWKIRDYTYHTMNDPFSVSLHTSTHPFASATCSNSGIVSFTAL